MRANEKTKYISNYNRFINIINIKQKNYKRFVVYSYILGLLYKFYMFNLFKQHISILDFYKKNKSLSALRRKFFIKSTSLSSLKKSTMLLSYISQTTGFANTYNYKLTSSFHKMFTWLKTGTRSSSIEKRRVLIALRSIQRLIKNIKLTYLKNDSNVIEKKEYIIFIRFINQLIRLGSIEKFYLLLAKQKSISNDFINLQIFLYQYVLTTLFSSSSFVNTINIYKYLSSHIKQHCL